MTTDSSTDSTSERASVTDCLAIGSIVNSNNHMDYVVEIFNDRDRERPPEPHECGFAQPVFTRKTVTGTEYAVFGVIYDTRLVDPDQGRSGPRLAQDHQREFTPGYVEERTKLAGIALLGTAEMAETGATHTPNHGMPPWTLEIDDVVFQCPDDVMAAFHRTSGGGLQMAYWDRLLDVAGAFGAEVTIGMVERLRGALDATDANQRVLDVIEQNVRWQAATDRGVVR